MPDVVAVPGLRGTSSFTLEGQRPKSFREATLRLHINGTAPLTALSGYMKTQSVDDPEFSWFEKLDPELAADATNVYTDEAMTSVYASGAVAGDHLHVKMGADDAKFFRAGQTCVITDKDNFKKHVFGIIFNRVVNGASSRISVTLITPDTYVMGGATTKRLLMSGTASSEGASSPDAISFDPTKRMNYTQIFRTPLWITRTARKTRLRTGDALAECRRDAFDIHQNGRERAYWFGEKSEGTGENGQPRRTTQGVLSLILERVPDNWVKYDLDADYAQKRWIVGGMSWFNSNLERIFRYGGPTRVGYCGGLALLAINEMCQANSQMNLTPAQTSFGMKVMRWITPFGEVLLKTHPMFVREPSLQRALALIEPENMRRRVIDDTMLKKDDGENKGGVANHDGLKDEYLTEDGLEIQLAEGFGFFDGLGVDNTVAAA